MRKLGLFLILGFAATSLLAANKSETFKLIRVKELISMLKNHEAPVILDANTQDVREKNGVIPVAVLLPSSSDYDIAKFLPAKKDSQLVFYCANEQCTASHIAAKRAIEAGYTRVAVLSPGIQGWKAAAQPTSKLKNMLER